jgi:hypothetical protein
MNSSLTPNELKVFQTISEFCENITTVFESNQKTEKIHALRLYNRLVTNVQFKDEVIIKKHIQSFRKFCILNREAIETKNINILQGNISFSEKIYIDIEWILNRLKNTENYEVCWKYLLTLSHLLDNESHAKDVLSSFNPQQLQSALPSLSSLSNSSDDILNMFNSPLFTQMLNLTSSTLGLNIDSKQINETIQSDEFKKVIGSVMDNVKNLDISQILANPSNMSENTRDKNVRDESVRDDSVRDESESENKVVEK